MWCKQEGLNKNFLEQKETLLKINLRATQIHLHQTAYIKFPPQSPEEEIARSNLLCNKPTRVVHHDHSNFTFDEFVAGMQSYSHSTQKNQEANPPRYLSDPPMPHPD